VFTLKNRHSETWLDDRTAKNSNQTARQRTLVRKSSYFLTTLQLFNFHLLKMTNLLAVLFVTTLTVSVSTAAEVGLYGFSENVELLRVFTNGTTSVISQVGTSGEYGQAQGLSTIDQTNGIFYSILFQLSTSKPFLVGVSLTSGKIVSSVPVPFVESGFIGVGQWLTFAGPDRVIVGGQDATQSHIMGTISPTKEFGHRFEC